jgi:aldehyde dehydrogenase (NAD+)
MATIVPSVKIPKITETQLFVGGRWEPSSNGKTFPTVNPATEEVLAEVSEGTAEDVDRAVQAARRALESGPWATMDARDRGAMLHRLADAIEREREELAVLETLDNGKRIGDARNVDVTLCVEALRYYGGYADKI